MDHGAYSMQAEKIEAARFRLVPRWIGVAVMLLGLMVVVAWHMHWQGFIQLSPGLPPMKYNTALGFILSGMSLVLLTTKHIRPAFWSGFFIAILGVLTFLEYLWNWNLGIDQIFMKDYVLTATAFPGRMSVLAAGSFTFLGVAFMLATARRRRETTIASGLLACVAGMIGGLALFGHFAGIEVATGWGAYTRLAVHTSAAFLLLGIGLFARCWQTSEREHFRLLRWAPITASLTLMAMIGIVSAASLAQLRSAIAWRKHSYEVIESAQSFQDGYIGIQRNVRGYVTLGTSDLLTAFQRGTNIWRADLDHLAELIRDNPAQGTRVKAMEDALQGVSASDDEMIATYQHSGAEGVLRLDATGKARTATGHLFDSVKAFTDEEKNLMNQRDAKEQSDYQSLENLLIFGSVLAAILLIMANAMAGRELTFRRRAEAKLQETLTLQQAILNSADYGIVSTAPNGLVRTFNPAAEKILGYSAEEVVGKQTPVLWRDSLEMAERAGKLSRKLNRPVKPTFEAITANVQINNADEGEWTFIRKDGSRFTSLVVVTALADEAGISTGYLGVFRDISDRKRSEAEREKLILDLRNALAEVKTLSGMIPICGWCKSVRSDQGFWQTVEQYVHSHTDASFSHGICPTCQEKFKADVAKAGRQSNQAAA
jgi:PAS domain-containing protein